MAEKSAPPAQTFRMGALSVTVWGNDTPNGGKRYSAQPSRSYLKDEEWQRTDYFNQADLLNLAKLCERAEAWIAQSMATATPRNGNKQRSPDDDLDF